MIIWRAALALHSVVCGRWRGCGVGSVLCEGVVGVQVAVAEWRGLVGVGSSRAVRPCGRQLWGVESWWVSVALAAVVSGWWLRRRGVGSALR